MIFLSEILQSNHLKKEFDCGNLSLNNYLQKQAGQDFKRKLSVTYVITDKSYFIKGYYTLSNNSLPLDNIPEKLRKKLPKSYQKIPTILIGRLAVDLKHQNKGIGKLLLIDALKRCFLLSKSLGTFAIIVDPLDDDAVNFYLKHGFILLPDSEKMFIPMKTIDLLFK